MRYVINLTARVTQMDFMGKSSEGHSTWKAHVSLAIAQKILVFPDYFYFQ